MVQLGFLNLAFGTVPLDPGQWLTWLVMVSAVLWYGELRKLLLRHRRRCGAGPVGTG